MQINIQFELLELLNAFSILQSVYEQNESDNFATDLLEDALNTIKESVANFYRENQVTDRQIDQLYDTQRLLFEISRNCN